MTAKKTCTRCGEEKPLAEFQANKACKDGKRPDCKKCCSNLAREYRTLHRDVLADRKKSYYEKNSERIMAQHRDYISRNEEAVFLLHRKYRERNKAAIAKWWAKSPRGRFATLMALAVRRRRTENPATVDQLMGLWEACDGKCAMSGIQMVWSQGATLPESLSIDRIDSAGDYSIGNVRLVCYQINVMKNRWSDDQMIKMARAVIAKADDRPKLKLVS